ncbi:hypothetical protein [Shewanella sp. YIC-542]|uniref:hypothetical protein n=1 Tax=Shewanella mytili TaxID=3377111 RepID=UPI00398E770E
MKRWRCGSEHIRKAPWLPDTPFVMLSFPALGMPVFPEQSACLLSANILTLVGVCGRWHSPFAAMVSPEKL